MNDPIMNEFVTGEKDLGYYGYNEPLVAAADIVSTILSLAIWIFTIVCWWKIFVKASEPGWKAIVPFYNSYTMFKITWRGFIYFITLGLSVFMVIGLISMMAGAVAVLSGQNGDAPMLLGALITAAAGIGVLVFSILQNIKLSKAFGHGGGFAVGLILLTPIFLGILAFGNSQYVGSNKSIISSPAGYPDSIPSYSPMDTFYGDTEPLFPEKPLPPQQKGLEPVSWETNGPDEN